MAEREGGKDLLKTTQPGSRSDSEISGLLILSLFVSFLCDLHKYDFSCTSAVSN